VLLLLGDGTRLPVTELPGDGPWTFLVVQSQPATAPPASVLAADDPGRAGEPDPAPAAGEPEPGAAARFLTRYGRVVVPDLRRRPGFGAASGEAGLLGLADDLDQIRTRAGLGRPILVGLGELAAVALRAGVDQPWAWRALVLVPATGRRLDPADLGELDLPALLLGDPGPVPAPDGVDPVPVEGGPEMLTGAVAGPAAERVAGPVAAAVERLLGRLGGGPGWSGIAPDAPPR
jgi:pimeloyl-ACP methyl ester carboxylesterase